MEISKMREEFDAWVKSQWPAQSLAQFNDGEYQGFTVHRSALLGCMEGRTRIAGD